MSYPNEPGEHRRWTDEQWKDWKLVEKGQMAAEPLSIEEEAKMYKRQWFINDRALRRHDAKEAKRCEKIFDYMKWEAECNPTYDVRRFLQGSDIPLAFFISFNYCEISPIDVLRSGYVLPDLLSTLM